MVQLLLPMTRDMWWQSLSHVALLASSARLLIRLNIVIASALVVILAAGAAGSPAEAHTLRSLGKARRHVVRRALGQLGTKYTWAGESPKKGFDCSGLTKWAFDGHGSLLPHQSLLQYQLGGSNGYKRIKRRKNLVKGDIVAFKTSSAKVGHVGIYIGGGEFVSAIPSTDSVRIDDVNDPYYWGERWVGATRVPL